MSSGRLLLFISLKYYNHWLISRESDDYLFLTSSSFLLNFSFVSEWLDDCEAAAKGQQGGAHGAPEEGAAPRQDEYDDDDDDDDDDDIPGPVTFASRKDDRKRPAQDTQASRKQQKTGGGERETYTALGLDDSDTDSDEE